MISIMIRMYLSCFCSNSLLVFHLQFVSEVMASLNVAKTPLSLVYRDWKNGLVVPSSANDFDKVDKAIRAHWEKLKVTYI